jgi:hypothetical protein
MHKRIQTFGLFIAGLIFICYLDFVHGSVGNALGKEFIIALPPLAIAGTSVLGALIPENSTISIIINTMGSTNATIFIGTGGVITIPPFINSQTVVLPSSLIPVGMGNSPLGIYVQTQDLSGVQITVNSLIYGSEGTLVAPMPGLVTRYILNGPPENPSFSIVKGKEGKGSVGLRFPNGTTMEHILGPLEIFHLKGSEYLGTIIEAGDHTDIAVFSGRDCTGEVIGSCTHLLEQMSSVIDFYSSFFYFINPISFQLELDSAFVEPLIPIGCGLIIGNANASSVEVRISEQKPIKLDEQGSIAVVQTTEPFHYIESDGAIDVQAICRSPLTNDEIQIQLLGAYGNTETTYFYAQPDGRTLILLMVYDDDFNVPGASLKFNGIPFDLGRFKSVGFNVSIATFIPSPGRNIMTSSGLYPFSYIYDFSKANFGSIAGRFF